MRLFSLAAVLLTNTAATVAGQIAVTVAQSEMERIYEEVKTPYKYGLVMTGGSKDLMTDSPTVFREGDRWYMTYIIYDGRGYETWLAESDDLLRWETTGRVMSFSDDRDWDANQTAGYPALIDTQWGGSYGWVKFGGRYWASYLGGPASGYEAGLLSIGMAYTPTNPAKPHEWYRMKKPVLLSTDADARWWEKETIFKSSVIWDQSRTTGYPFVMYYNAKQGAERIGMAVSDDMVNWRRLGEEPVLEHGGAGITGDAHIQKIGDVWVMFYFGAFWETRPEGAWDSFACSYDLVNWTDWTGDDLVSPSEEYDAVFAHKPCMVKHNGIVYHFYCAVDRAGNRGIALATSKDLGKSSLRF